jgi:hypothetical protein
VTGPRRLLIAAGELDRARDRLDVALRLADGKGVYFSDAELFRLRACTQPDPTRHGF